MARKKRRQKKKLLLVHLCHQERVNEQIDTPSFKGGRGELKDAERQLFTTPKKQNSESDYHVYGLE